MNNKPENDSCKDIAADLREDARQIRRVREIATRMEPQPTMRGRFLDEIFTAYADRLDAVAKPETVYNMAAMREALERVEKLARGFAVGNYYVSDFPKMLHDAIQPVLAAPPRNCDRFGGDYKMLHTAWFDWTASPSGQNPDGTAKMAFGEWLLAPVQKGGAV